MAGAAGPDTGTLKCVSWPTSGALYMLLVSNIANSTSDRAAAAAWAQNLVAAYGKTCSARLIMLMPGETLVDLADADLAQLGLQRVTSTTP